MVPWRDFNEVETTGWEVQLRNFFQNLSVYIINVSRCIEMNYNNQFTNFLNTIQFKSYGLVWHFWATQLVEYGPTYHTIIWFSLMVPADFLYNSIISSLIQA